MCSPSIRPMLPDGWSPPFPARSAISSLRGRCRTGRSDGLGLVRSLADEGRAWLRSGGWLLVEVSPDLARSVRGILIKAGYVGVKSHRDRLGATRVVAGCFQG